MKKYISIILTVLITLTLAACATGPFNKSKVSDHESIEEKFTLIILTEGFPVDGLFAAVLDIPSDNIHITKSGSATVHSTLKNVTIKEALRHMIPLMKKHCAYSSYLVNRLMHGGVNAGYEIVPSHSEFICSPAPYISINYRADGEMKIKVSLSVMHHKNSRGLERD